MEWFDDLGLRAWSDLYGDVFSGTAGFVSCGGGAGGGGALEERRQVGDGLLADFAQHVVDGDAEGHGPFFEDRHLGVREPPVFEGDERHKLKYGALFCGQESANGIQGRSSSRLSSIAIRNAGASSTDQRCRSKRAE